MRIATVPSSEAGQAAKSSKSASDLAREADLDREFSETLDKAAKKLARYAGITYMPDLATVSVQHIPIPTSSKLTLSQDDKERSSSEGKFQEESSKDGEALSPQSGVTGRPAQASADDKSKGDVSLKSGAKANSGGENMPEVAQKASNSEVSRPKESTNDADRSGQAASNQGNLTEVKESEIANKQSGEEKVVQAPAPPVAPEASPEALGLSAENIEVKISQSEIAATVLGPTTPTEANLKRDVVAPEPNPVPAALSINVVPEIVQVSVPSTAQDDEKMAVLEVKTAQAPGSDIDDSNQPIMAQGVARSLEEVPKVADSIPAKAPQISLIEQVMQAVLLAQGAGVARPISGVSAVPSTSTPETLAAIQVLKPALDISSLRETSKGLMAAANSNALDGNLLGRGDNGKIGVGLGDRMPAKPVPSPSPNPLPRPIKMIERIEQALKEAIRAKDGKSISLRLDPPQLGSVRVEVTFRDGALHARVTAENHQVNQLIRERIHELHAALRKLGLNINDVTVAVGSEAGLDSAGEEANQTANQWRQQQKNLDLGPELANNQEGAPFEPQPANFDHWVA